MAAALLHGALRGAAPTTTASAWPVLRAPTATEAVAAAWDRIRADGREGVWIALADEGETLRAAAEVERRQARGEHLVLAGVTLAVKDNIDVAGFDTTAGCPAYAYRPTASAAAVRALVAAGAVVLGKTNLDQFATGLTGTRSPYGVCPNAFWPDLVAGGSSSGSAVAVAAGMVDLALGTDTAGSGRVPAAANGIIGMKPTPGRVSAAGVVPACRSLDCVSVFARALDLGALALDLLAATSPDDDDPWSRPPPAPAPPAAAGRTLRVGVPRPQERWFDGDVDGARRFEASVDALAGSGFEPLHVELLPFLEVGPLLYEGAFVAERFEAVGRFVVEHHDDVHAVVGRIIAEAGVVPGWQVFRDRTRLRQLARRCAGVWEAVDVLAVPSVPRVPTVAEALAEPVATSAMLGTYTSFVNLLGMSALTVALPAVAGAGAGPPPSITLLGPGGADGLLVRVAESLPLGTPASLCGG